MRSLEAWRPQGPRGLGGLGQLDIAPGAGTAPQKKKTRSRLLFSCEPHSDNARELVEVFRILAQGAFCRRMVALLLWSLGTEAGAVRPLVHTAVALDSDSAIRHADIVIASRHRALYQTTLLKVVGQPLLGGSPCLGLQCVMHPMLAPK